MKTFVLPLALLAALLAPAAALADTVYYVQGKLSNGATFSGSFNASPYGPDPASITVVGGKFADPYNNVADLENTSHSTESMILSNPTSGPTEAYIFDLFVTRTGTPALCVSSSTDCDGMVTEVGYAVAPSRYPEPFGITGGIEATSGSISLTPPSATPEPSSLALLGTGVLGFAGATRRRFAR